jgi:RecJ-like exonuclease
MKTCPDCNGDGVIDRGTDDEKQCPTCGGSGFVPDDNDDKNNDEVIRTYRSLRDYPFDNRLGWRARNARAVASTAKRR